MKNCIEGNEITTVLDTLDLKLEGAAPFITDSQNTNFTTYVQKTQETKKYTKHVTHDM